MEGRGSGILPAVSGVATGRGTPTSAIGEFGTVGSDKIRPFGCRVRQFHAKIRSGIGPTSRRHATRRAGRAQKTSAHKAQETPPAGPNGCTVCLVSKVGKSGVLRPPDARMLSWRVEVSPYRSGGTERGNHPKSRSDRL